MGKFSCSKCGYCWKSEEDDFPCCHFDDHGGLYPAPCEYGDYESAEEAEEEVNEEYTLDDLGRDWW